MPDKRERKEIIIKEAQKLFSRFGFIKTTVEEIARAARMGKASLYYYFSGKEEIFKEVIRKESEFLNTKIREAVEKEKTLQGKIEAYVITRMRYLRELANIYHALKDKYFDHYAFINETRKKNFNMEIKIIKSILNEGVAKNIFIIEDVDLTAFAIVSSLKGLEYNWAVEIPMPKMEESINKLLDILFYGINRR